jgi:uncharacterized integral membrane protein (TIGR00698 family)
MTFHDWRVRLAVWWPWLVLALAAALVILRAWSPAMALALGIGTGALLGRFRPDALSGWSSWLLKTSIVGLGFGLHFDHLASQAGVVLAMAAGTLVLALMTGMFLGKVLQVPSRTSWLLACGSGICGGSAIAAVAPVLKADDHEVATALSVVFMLNAVALFVFPWLGAWLGLSQSQFGVWAGLAIHDTSSVVGAAAAYGDAALQVAVPVKLMRALMIVPLVLTMGFLATNQTDKTRVRAKLPGFILLFVAASLLSSYVPSGKLIWDSAVTIGRQLLVLALFVMGVGIRPSVFGRGSGRPLLQGLLLWLVLSGAALAVALHVPWSGAPQDAAAPKTGLASHAGFDRVIAGE